MSSVSLPSPVPRMMPTVGVPAHLARTAAAASWIWSYRAGVVMAARVDGGRARTVRCRVLSPDHGRFYVPAAVRKPSGPPVRARPADRRRPPEAGPQPVVPGAERGRRARPGAGRTAGAAADVRGRAAA